MLHSVKTLMLVGLLTLLPVAAVATIAHKTVEPGASRWAGSLSTAPSQQGRGPSIDPLGTWGKVRAVNDSSLIRVS